MNILTPIDAATLAAEVYAVNKGDSLALDLFLKNPLFYSGTAKAMSATVGFRAINATDGFGVCALGAGIYANHIIIVFRGSTEANHGADWASNARSALRLLKLACPCILALTLFLKACSQKFKHFCCRIPQHLWCIVLAIV